jgi:transposase InsO family protein
MNSRHDLPIAPNRLGRPFMAGQPDTVRQADISYIATDEGFFYVTALATRRIVGCAMADHLKSGVCIDALVMTLQRYRLLRGLIHRSERGV